MTPKQMLSAIYTLSDSDGRVRYVGKTNNPDKRLREHLRARTSLPVAFWIAKLRRQGSLPVMRVVEWTSDWETAERRWIAKYRANSNLLNLADGGAGILGISPDWARQSAVAYADDLLARIKPFATWLTERKRTGCEILTYWGVQCGIVSARAQALRARA